MGVKWRWLRRRWGLLQLLGCCLTLVVVLSRAAAAQLSLSCCPAQQPRFLHSTCTLLLPHILCPPPTRYMLASLKEAALAVGHPEWGHGGPHDSGHYNSHSSETGFFKSYGGSWDSGAHWVDGGGL